MTAYLQPGDKIHLAFGIDSNLASSEKVRQANENAAHHTSQYAALGIEVVMWTANSVLTHPVVVSVIRPWQPLTLPETRD